MLSKEVFVKCLNFMKEREAAMDQINKVFTEEFEDSVFYPYFRYDAMLMKVLADAMNDEGDWISYFICEGHYGKDLKPDSVSEADGTPIDITTPEKLYDFLVKEYFNREGAKED